MMASAPFDPARRAAAIALLLGIGLAAPVQAQSEPSRGVFINQIADDSRVTVTQSNAGSLAQVRQDGIENTVTVMQDGSAPQTARITQDGAGSTLLSNQSGNGSTVLDAAQDGDGNTATLRQRETIAGVVSTARIQQLGNRNRLSLDQDGSDNAADLSQIGDDNAMTAVQQGDGNRLQWAQNGDGLSDLQITQTGSAVMQITQSMTGAQFAPPPGSGN